ncbi:MAG: copper resistance protein CopC [Actinomycetales bacterium]|nr:copper resistance protein CopC [Actinomycetales bacterium]
MKFPHKSAFIALLSASLVALAPLAANAHDEVVGTTPAADSTVSAGAVTVSVTFNEDIMKSADFAGEAIEVTDALGDQVTLTGTCLAVEGATLSAPMNFPANGDYAVNWRSVSNDGHPSEGSFSFTVTNASDSANGVQHSMGPALGGSCNAVYSAIDRAYTDATPMAISAPAPSATPTADPFITNLPYLGAGLILVVLGGIAGPVVQKIRQRRAAVKAELKKLQDEEQNG